jgi:hypothetical protein
VTGSAAFNGVVRNDFALVPRLCVFARRKALNASRRFAANKTPHSADDFYLCFVFLTQRTRLVALPILLPHQGVSKMPTFTSVIGEAALAKSCSPRAVRNEAPLTLS